MHSIKHIIEHISDVSPEAVLWDGFDDCIVGLTYEGKVVYEQSLMIAKLMRENGMSAEESIEYLDYNVFNTYVGDGTPVHIILFDVQALGILSDGGGYDHTPNKPC